MKTHLKLLLLEDDPLDAELNINALEEEGYECEWERVQMKDEFIAALEKPNYDIILIDYNLPAFDGMSALHILRERELDIPAMLVSGNLGEELAIESMKAGAVDYVHKDRLGRLAPSVKRALQENELRLIEREQSNDLAFFGELNQAANKGASLNDLADLIAAEIRQNFDIFAMSLNLIDKDQKYLEMINLPVPLEVISKLEALTGLSNPNLRLPLGKESVYGQVLEGRKPRLESDADFSRQVIVDYVLHSSLPEKAKKSVTKLIPTIQKMLKINTVIAIPIINGDETLGLLGISSHTILSDKHIKRLNRIASQIAVILSRKKAEEEITRLQKSHQLILDSADEGIVGVNIEGKLTFANPSAALMLGRSEEEMRGQENHKIFRPTNKNGQAYPKKECPVYATYTFGENIYEGNAEFWRKDFGYFPVLYSSTVIEAEGERVGAVITFRDISKQVEDMREIARLAEVVEQASVSVTITDLAGNLVYVNPYFEKSSGYSVAEALGKNPRVLKSGVQDETFYKKLWKTLVKGETWHDTFVNKRKDGSLYHEDANIFPIKTPEGEIINYAAVKRDITAQVEADKALKEEKDFSERVINTSNALIIGLDKDHLIRLFNKGAEIVTGYKREEVLGKDWFLLAFMPDIRAEMNDVWENAWGIISHTYINPIWTKSGEKRIISWQSTGFYEDLDEEKQLLLSIGEDITERKKVEEQVRLQLSRLDALHSIDVEILSNIDIKAILDVVLEQVKKGLGVDAANVLLFNSSLNSLEYATQFGFKAGKLDYKFLRLGKGLAGKTALERKTIYIQDLSKEKDLLAQTPALIPENFCSYFGIPLLSQGKLKGVLEIFHRTTLTPDKEWRKFLEMLGGQVAIAIDNISLFENLQRNNMELRLAYDTTLEGWARALELRDIETLHHSRRVTKLTEELSILMGINVEQLEHIRRGALLHDIGKMGVRDVIFYKPGPLNEDEWVEMKKHPVFAYEMLKGIPYLEPALKIPYSHHEKWDGSGYPQGMQGERIPLEARIFAIIDVYDSLTSKRPYRTKIWTKTEALDYIQEQSGTHFDPQIVKTFLRMMAERDEE